jgi:hypothetical protein
MRALVDTGLVSEPLFVPRRSSVDGSQLPNGGVPRWPAVTRPYALTVFPSPEAWFRLVLINGGPGVGATRDVLNLNIRPGGHANHE